MSQKKEQIADAEEQTLGYREALLRAQERDLNELEEQLSRKEAELIRGKLKLGERESQMLDRELAFFSKGGTKPAHPLQISVDVGTGDYRSQEVAKLDRTDMIVRRAEHVRSRLSVVEARRQSLQGEEENLRRAEKQLELREKEIARREELEREISEKLFGARQASQAQMPPQYPSPPAAQPQGAAAPQPVLDQLRYVPKDAPSQQAARDTRMSASHTSLNQGIYLGGGSFAGEIAVSPLKQQVQQPGKAVPKPPPLPPMPAASPAEDAWTYRSSVSQAAAQLPPPIPEQPRPAQTPPPLPKPAHPSAEAQPPPVAAAPPVPKQVPAPAAPAPVEQPASRPPPVPKDREGPESRHDPRATVEVEVGLSTGSNFFTGFTSNISKGGLFVETHMPLPNGKLVNLIFSLPDGRKIYSEGEVMWVKEYNDSRPIETPGMGIRFKSLSPADEKAINNFLRKREPIFYED